ncbi:MAG: glycosyltransferase [Infirmifilum sp.]
MTYAIVREFEFSVVIIAKNEPKIKFTLESLAKQSLKPSEVVVVVDEPNDLSAVISREYVKVLPLRIVVNRIRGYGGARATGVNASRGDVIAFIDADAIAENTWLEEYARIFRERPEVLVQFGGNYVIKDPVEIELIRLGRLKRPFSDFGFTQNMAFRREVIDIVGNFDPWFNDGGEDLDFVIRLKKYGIAAYKNPKAIVYHFVNGGINLRKAWRDGKARAKNFIKHRKAQLIDTLTVFFHGLSLIFLIILTSIGCYKLALLMFTPSLAHRLYRAILGVKAGSGVLYALVSSFTTYVSYLAFIVYILTHIFRHENLEGH